MSGAQTLIIVGAGAWYVYRNYYNNLPPYQPSNQYNDFYNSDPYGNPPAAPSIPSGPPVYPAPPPPMPAPRPPRAGPQYYPNQYPGPMRAAAPRT